MAAILQNPGQPQAARQPDAPPRQEPRQDGPCSGFIEWCSRSSIASAAAWFGKKIFSTPSRVAQAVALSCNDIYYGKFLSFYNEQVPQNTLLKSGVFLNCRGHVTCFDACTKAFKAVQETGCSYGPYSSCFSFSEKVFEDVYYGAFKRGTGCSFPKKCLNACKSALEPWSTASKTNAAHELINKEILPLLGGLNAAALADTVIGSSLEESDTKEAVRVVAGTIITAIFVPTITEAALFYLGYRISHTCMRLLLCGFDRRRAAHEPLHTA